MTRTVYISREDQDTWQRAKLFCKQHNVSISRFIADALRYYLDKLIGVN